MNRPLHALVSAVFAAATIGGVTLQGTLPASAAIRGDCASAHNLMHVHRRLDGAIDRLSHDQHDYGGHRVTAMNDLQAARTEIVAAESYAESNGHDNAACFTTRGGTGGSDANWGTRGQYGSNANIWSVRRSVDVMMRQLTSDEHDYGGHKGNAVNDMQQARNELVAAERYAKAHGK